MDEGRARPAGPIRRGAGPLPRSAAEPGTVSYTLRGNGGQERQGGRAHASDQATLEALRSLYRSVAGLSSSSVLCLLGRADELTRPDEDHWPAARALAADTAHRLRGLVADVVPFVGLWAETARAGRLTEQHARLLRVVADRPERDLDEALFSFLDLVDAVEEVPRPELESLVERLGMRGLGWLARQPPAGAAAVVEQLDAASNVAEVIEHIDHTFRAQADELKTLRAVATLHHHLAPAGDATEATGPVVALRRAVAALLEHPDLWRLRLRPALRLVNVGELQLPEPLLEHLRAAATGGPAPRQLGLTGGAGAAEVTEAAMARARQWKVFANNLIVRVAVQAAVDDVRRYWELLTATARNEQDAQEAGQ